MNSIFKKIGTMFAAFGMSWVTIAQDNTSPAYTPGVYYSLNKTITGYATSAPPAIDGVFDDFVWVKKAGYNAATNSFPIESKLTNSINVSGNTPSSNIDGRFEVDTETENVTFAVAWDTTYIYIAGVVKSASFKALPNLPAKVGEAIPLGKTAFEVFYGGDPTTRKYAKDGEGAFDISFAGSRQYASSDIQFRVGPTINASNTFLSTGTQSIAFDKTGFTDEGIVAFAKITDQGYNVEMSIKWKSLDESLLDLITGNYSNPDFKPKEGRNMLLDIGYTLSKVDGTSRFAQIMWNACCVNRNWMESIHWGNLVLSGNPGPANLKGVTLSGSNISDGNPINLVTSVDPEDANKNLKYDVITDACKPVLRVTPNGQVIPLNNGTATIIGTSLSSVFEANATSVTSVIITVSNQSPVTTIEVPSGEISSNWGSYSLTANVSPASANSLVTWSLVNGDNLVSLNSITGLITSKSLESSSSITVKATSVSDCNISSEGVLQLSNQIPITSENLAITVFSNKSCNSNDNAMTILGFTPNNQRLTLRGVYYVPGQAIPSVVQADLMSYSFMVPRGQTLGNILTSSKVGGDTEILIKAGVGTFTIVGTYLNSNVTKTVRVRLAASTPETTCPGPINTSPTIDASSLEVSPNPTSGTFSVDLSLSKASSVNVSVLNSVGSLVYSSTTAQGVGASKIPVAAVLTKGIYIVKVSSADGTSLSKKLVVE